MTDPFALKFYSLIQNLIGGGLNFVKCEQTFTENTVQCQQIGHGENILPSAHLTR